MSEMVQKKLWRKQVTDVRVVVVMAVLFTFVQGSQSLPICTCGPGLVVKVPCVDNKDAVCEACPPHHFKHGRDETRQCQPCDDECPAKGMSIIKKCTSTNNLTCQCKKNSIQNGLSPVCECKKDYMARFLPNAGPWEYDCVPCPPGHYTPKPSLQQKCIRIPSGDISSQTELGSHSRSSDLSTSATPQEAIQPSVPRNSTTDVPQSATPTDQPPVPPINTQEPDKQWLYLLLVIPVVIFIVAIVLRYRRKCCFGKMCNNPCCYDRSSSEGRCNRTRTGFELGAGMNGFGTPKRQQGPDARKASSDETTFLRHNNAQVGGPHSRESGEISGLHPYEKLNSITNMALAVRETARSENSLDTLKPVGVAIIDTGLMLDHPCVKPFHDRIKFKKNLFDDSDNVQDRNGHGTFIFGIFAEAFKNICDGIEFYIIKAFEDNGSFNEETLEIACKELLKLPQVSVVCIAGGFQGEPSKDSVVRAVNELCLCKTVIAAASNEGNLETDQIAYPGRVSIAIGSINHYGRRSGFSPQGQALFGLGFGDDIRSINAKFQTDSVPLGDDGHHDRDRIKRTHHKVDSGSSYATGWVSVIAALCLYNLQAFPDFKFESLRKTRYMRRLLKQMGRDSSFSPEEGYGPLLPDNIFKTDVAFKNALTNAMRS